METRRLLWDQIEERLPPQEIEEVRNLLGPERIERGQQLAQELDVLSMMSQQITPNTGFDQDYRDYEDKISFFIEQLHKKSDESIANINQREKEVFDSFSSRPGTARRDETRPSTSLSSRSVANSVFESLPTSLNLNSLDAILQDLKQSIDEENAQLLEEVDGLQECLIDGIRPKEDIDDMVSLSVKLETAYEAEVEAQEQMDSKPDFDLVEKPIQNDDFFGLDASLFEGLELNREPRPVKPTNQKAKIKEQKSTNVIAEEDWDADASSDEEQLHFKPSSSRAVNRLRSTIQEYRHYYKK